MKILLIGPQACGKTRYSERVAERFGLDIIIDDWYWKASIRDHALHITCDEGTAHEQKRRNEFDIILQVRTEEDIQAIVRNA